MKKLFFTLCALCLCGTMWAQDTQYDETKGLYFTVTNGVATIVAPENGSYTIANLVNDSEGVYSLPTEVTSDGQTYAVTTIGASAFENALTDTNSLIHLVIPEGVDTLNYRSFYGCTQIGEATVEYSTTDLRQNDQSGTADCFVGCSNIKTVTINRNLTHGRNNAQFGNIVWTFSKLPSIETAYIGEYVTSLTNNAFNANGESQLSAVYCYATNPPTLATNCFLYKAEDCVLYVHPYSLELYQGNESWVDIFGSENIQALNEEEEQPEGTLMDKTTGLFFEIDESTDVVSIIKDQESGAYYDANLVAVDGQENTYTLPYYVEDKNGTSGYVTRIDESAFANSAISGHLVIPAHIVNMGESAFQNCTGLTEVTYEYSETALKEENDGINGENMTGGSFQGCTSVTTVNLYRDIEYLSTLQQPGAFVGTTSVATINIGPRVTKIPDFMFRNTTTRANGGGPIKTINSYAVEPPTLTNSPFARMGDNTLNVPQGTAEAYSSASVWTAQINSDGTGNDYGICTLNEMSDAFAITTHDNGETAYATFYNSGSNVELFNGELTAYVAYQLDEESDGLYIEIESIGNTVPAGTGVIVETPTAGTYLAIANGDETVYSGDNDLYGSDTTTDITVPGDGYLYYLLSSYDGQVGFYWGEEEGAPFECQAHRAYLALLQDDVKNYANQISIRKGSGEDTTGISSVESAVEGASVKGIYTIQGVRVSNMNQPGLYIVDGKKVLKR